jgi:hypothetical protein
VTTSDNQPVRRPSVGIFLFLWGAWLGFRLLLIFALLYTFRWEHGRLTIYLIGLPMILMGVICTLETWNKPPWRVPAPERWVRK